LITGIEPDLQALRAAGKKVRDIDELMRNVQQRLDSALVSQSGGKAAPSIDISQEKLEGHTLMVVRVSTAAPGIWFHYHAAEDHGEIFTVRIGNASKDLTRDEEHDFRAQWERSGGG
jgi:hypothetical protein